MYNDVYIVQAIINDIAHYSILETIHLDKSIIERAYIFDEWNYYGIMESILVDNVVISSDYIPYDPNQISGEKIEFDKIAYRVKKIVKNDFPN